MNPLVEQVRAVSARQGGHITRAQLHRAGLSPSAIAHLVRTGVLIRVYRGVYAVGRPAVRMLDRAHAALLAAGPASALTGGSAAGLCGVQRLWPLPFEVATATDRRPGGLIIRHRPNLLPRDFAVIEGLRTTSRALTLLDRAPHMGHHQLVRAVNGQRVDHRLGLEALYDVLERFPHHPGRTALQAVVVGAPDEPDRSPWETEWHPYAAAHDFPEYDTNVFVCSHRVDVKFKHEGVIVELDGWGTHSGPDAFERDRDVPNQILAETGMPTVRITRRQFRRSPAKQAERLHAILARRRQELGLP